VFILPYSLKSQHYQTQLSHTNMPSHTLIGVVMVIAQVLFLQVCAWYEIDVIVLGIQAVIYLSPLLVLSRAWWLPLVLPPLPRRRMNRRNREYVYLRWLCAMAAWHLYCFARGRLVSELLMLVTDGLPLFMTRSVIFVVLGLL